MDSPEYAAAYNEAKSLGGDGVHTPSARTPEQSFIGIFWAYDGTPSLCAPPRLYNQIIIHIADQRNLGTVDLARLLALANNAKLPASSPTPMPRRSTRRLPASTRSSRTGSSDQRRLIITSASQPDSYSRTIRRIRPATEVLAAPSSKRSADFSAPTTSRSPLSPTNSTA